MYRYFNELSTINISYNLVIIFIYSIFPSYDVFISVLHPSSNVILLVKQNDLYMYRVKNYASGINIVKSYMIIFPYFRFLKHDYLLF